MVTAPTTLGRYRLGEVIGAGGMGTVLRATDELLGREVALKLLRDDLVGDPRALARFRQEARIAASLSHPGIAAVYDFAEEPGRQAIVMELLDGQDLHALVQGHGPLEPAYAADLLAQAADALAYAHSFGAVHRDIKPANIVLTTDGRVKLTDFGVAYAGGGGQLTTTGALVGTPDYLSPEQVRGERATAASDIYSLGCVGYEVLVGRPPFTGDNSIAVATARLDVAPPSARAANPAVSESLDAVICCALDPIPTRRFPSASAMARALRAAAGSGATATSGSAPTVALPLVLPGTQPGPQQGLQPGPQRGPGTPAVGPAAAAAIAAGPLPGPADPGPAGAATAIGGPQTTKLASSPATRVDFVPYGSPATPPWGTPMADPAAGPPPHAGARRRHSRWNWLWLPVMVILVGGIIFDIAAAWQKHNATVVVPPWANASVQTATAAAQHLGLKVHPVDTSSTVEAGTVLSTLPKAGSHLKKGSTVTLSVSRGNQVHVDNVVSAMEPAAAADLQGQGLNPVQTADPNSTATAGQVTGQDPPAGATATKGDTVTLTVAAPQPSPPPAPAPTDTCGGLSGFLSQLGIGSCDTPAPPTPPGHHHGNGGGGGGGGGQ